MDAERARTFLLRLPHVVETQQWGGIVLWLGDKAVGGKMFGVVQPERTDRLPVSYAAGPERFAERVEQGGLQPAPYLARAFWVAAERWNVLRDNEWEQELGAAHAITLAKLPAKVRNMLELPRGELKRVVAERRRVLAVKAATTAKVGAKG